MASQDCSTKSTSDCENSKTFSAAATSTGNTNSSIANTILQTSDNGQCSRDVLTYRGYPLLV